MSERALLERVAIPASIILVSTLAFSSQLLFCYIQPGPLGFEQTVSFNAIVASVFLCYYRSVTTDPGSVPPDWTGKAPTSPAEPSTSRVKRWCRKCNAPKPPRAHHCRACARCVPKMDHHCPWTTNCVSHRTMPHFVRFILYSVVSLVYLETLLFARLKVLWVNRHWPHYHGPSVLQLGHLFMLTLVNTVTMLAMSILFIRVLWILGSNTTTIEGWEIDRHRALLRRARTLGGSLPTADGEHIRIVKQEFPYDIGIWRNVCQGMGTANPLAWFFPLSRTLPLHSGLSFPVNGLEEGTVSWPPPDPDRRVYSSPASCIPGPPELNGLSGGQPGGSGKPASGPYTDAEIDAFRERQRRDLQRWDTNASPGPSAQRQEQDHVQAVRRRPFHERYGPQVTGGPGTSFAATGLADDAGGGGEEGWRNAEGEQLADFGVDPDLEFYDESSQAAAATGPGVNAGLGTEMGTGDEDLPLRELLARKKA